MPSQMRLSLENWLKTIDVKTESLLDVGGSQKLLKGRTKSWDVTNYKVLDLERPHEGNKPDIVCDLNTFKWDVVQSPLFHTIFCLEVMEYLWNPVNALKVMNDFLWKSGELYISFPFIYPLHPPTGLDYMRYTKYGAIKLLEETGFKVEEYTPRTTDHIETLHNYFAKAGYKHDKKEDRELLRETGSLIKATKV